MPLMRRMRTVDERTVRVAANAMFDLARDVEAWPRHLPHYRYVRFHDRRQDGGGVVEMAAYRPFGVARWPTWWMADMQVLQGVGGIPAIRFRHIAGVTRGMEVEWSFAPTGQSFAPVSAAVATFVRIVHLWDGPRWPLVGGTIATTVIGPVFIHGSHRGRWPAWRPRQSARRRTGCRLISCRSHHRTRNQHQTRELERESIGMTGARRVAVTGIGAIAPIGSTADGLWCGLRREQSVVGLVTRFDPSPFRSHIAAEVKNFVPTDHLDRSERSVWIALASFPW